MEDFQLYVTDDRYDVQSLLFVMAKDVGGARRIAERVLGEPHHHAVEVWGRSGRLFTVTAALSSATIEAVP